MKSAIESKESKKPVIGYKRIPEKYVVYVNSRSNIESIYNR